MNSFATCVGSGINLGTVFVQAVAPLWDVFTHDQVVKGTQASNQVAVAKQVILSEREQAVAIRAAWMRQMGLSEDEIQEACEDTSSIDLDEEVRNLQAANKLAQVTPSRSELEAWATKY